MTVFQSLSHVLRIQGPRTDDLLQLKRPNGADCGSQAGQDVKAGLGNRARQCQAKCEARGLAWRPICIASTLKVHERQAEELKGS